MMVKKTCYFVRSIHRVDGRLVPGAVRQLRSREDARAVASALSDYDAGVVAYEVDGDPVLDIWDEPSVLAAYGVARA